MHWDSVRIETERVPDENPEVWINSARRNINANNFEQAMQELQQARTFAQNNRNLLREIDSLEQNISSPSVWLNQARQKISAGQYDAALSLIGKVENSARNDSSLRRECDSLREKIDRGRIGNWLNTAEQYFKDGDYNSAISTVQTAENSAQKYSDLQNKCRALTERINSPREWLNNSQRALNSNNYDDALNKVHRAEILSGNQRSLISECQRLRTDIERQKINSIISQAQMSFSSSNFDSALEKIYQAESLAVNYADLLSHCKDLEHEINRAKILSFITSARQNYESKNYDAALNQIEFAENLALTKEISDLLKESRSLKWRIKFKKNFIFLPHTWAAIILLGVGVGYAVNTYILNSENVNRQPATRIYTIETDKETIPTPRTSTENFQKQNTQQKTQQITVPQSSNPLLTNTDVGKVFGSYYKAIDNKNFQQAYSFLTPKCRKRLGSIASFAEGHNDTLSVKITDFQQIGASTTKMNATYKIRARDKVSGGGVLVQDFSGNVTLIKSGNKWLIDEISSKRVNSYSE